jgi:PIN domain nuclease of toxin-antitoxin system
LAFVGAAAKRLLDAADGGRATAHVPAIVLVEIALLYERGRLRVSAPRVTSELAKRPGWQVLALDIEQAVTFAALTGIRDPMDRMIAAAALALNVPLLSADEAHDVVGVKRCWD